MNEKNPVEEILEQNCFAVCGSFKDDSKYAYRILRLLNKKGKKAYPVNPKGGTVSGAVCYKKVEDIDDSVDAVSIVTPPEATEKIVRQCYEKGIKFIWIQPGAESEDAIKYCKEHGIRVVHNTCILMM